MIVSSAVWHCGRLFTGKRHHDCIRKAVAATGKKPVIGEQGFLTLEGIFLDRKAAAIHAIMCGQVTKLNWGDKLYSEDLW